MKEKRKNNKLKFIGLSLVGVFYLLSCIVVYFNNTGQKIIDPSLKTITFAHWNLEDGFREGFDEAIKRFEELKAAEGVKVKVIQTTVPYRGYKQWFLTQLISGDPADILKYTGSSNLRNMYFVPLSEYIAKPNPFNKNTPLADMPWKDTFIDGMNGALDSVYSEHFGVGTYFHTYRVFVNLDLLKKATGSEELPSNLSQWMEACKKIRKYGEKKKIPIIPIGVRGFDKSTIDQLFLYYMSQMCARLNDSCSVFCTPTASRTEILRAALNDDKVRKRILSTVEIMREIGNNFGEGFTAIDLEQTKFLFFSGKVGFFPEGTWNAYSMVKNSPFKVGIMELPVIGKGHRFSKYFSGKLSEQGANVGGAFGISKASKNFPLALEFLQFITSYEINQLIMNRCKWPPAVKMADYQGLMKKFQPSLEGASLSVPPPFSLERKSERKMLGYLETIIINNSANSGQKFWEMFVVNKGILSEEITNALTSNQRTLLKLEEQRTRMAISLLNSKLSQAQSMNIQRKMSISFEAYSKNLRNSLLKEQFLFELERLDSKRKGD